MLMRELHEELNCRFQIFCSFVEKRLGGQIYLDFLCGLNIVLLPNTTDPIVLHSISGDNGVWTSNHLWGSALTPLEEGTFFMLYLAHRNSSFLVPGAMYRSSVAQVESTHCEHLFRFWLLSCCL